MADVPGDAIDGGIVIGNDGGRRWSNRSGAEVQLGAIAAVDSTAPVVDNFSPPVGSSVLEADPVFFDVTDNVGFAQIVIAIKQGGATELVHDGTNFLPPYDDLSTRDNIASGFRYRVRRTGGWIEAVVQSAFVVDSSGNVPTP